MAPPDDHYAVLGVASSATAEQIKRAFRARVRGCHPDRVANLDDDLRRFAEAKMVALNGAYAVLGNDARRADYDARQRHGDAASASMNQAPASTNQAAAAPPMLSPTPPPLPPPETPEYEQRPPPTEPGRTSNRIGEQRVVASAAAERFRHTVKRCVPAASWTPLAFPGASEAIGGRRGRTHLAFVLFAAPRIDAQLARRFLQSIDTYGGKLKPRWFGHDRVYGFLGALEFTDFDRHRGLLERFNKRRSPTRTVQPVSYLDLADWHVLPGEISLQARLKDLLRTS